MAVTLVDLVKVYIRSSGTGAFLLGQAVSGFRGAEVLIDGEDYPYSVQEGSQYEVGTLTYVSATQMAVRNPEISSYGNGPVPFQANAQLVFTARAADYSTGNAAQAGADAGREAAEQIFDRFDTLVAEESLASFQNLIDLAQANGVSRVLLPPMAGGYLVTDPIIVGPLVANLEIVLHPKTLLFMDASSGPFIQATNCNGKVFRVVGNGARIDCSAQPVPDPGDGFGVIEAQDYAPGSLIQGITFYAGGDYRTPVSDSPIFVQGRNMNVDWCQFIGGFSDACVYDSADGFGRDGYGTLVTRCYASRVNLFAISKRLAKGMTVEDCQIIEAYQGVATGSAQGEAGLLAPGTDVTVNNTEFRDCAIPVRLSWAHNSHVAASVRINGFGFDLDGNIASAGAAISLRGCDRATVAATVRNTSVSANAGLHGVLLTAETVSGTTLQTTNTTIKGELDGGVGAGRAIFEQGTADYNASEVTMRGVWDNIIVQVGANSSFQYNQTTDRSWRMWRGGSDRWVLGGSMTFRPGSGSDVFRVQRWDSPLTSFMDQYTDSGGHRFTQYSPFDSSKKVIFNNRTITAATPTSGNCDIEFQWNSVPKLRTTQNGAWLAAPVFADQAAAAAGGLISGELFRTPSYVLMVKS